MAVQIQRAGYNTVKVQWYGGSLTTLGYTLDMTDVSDQSYWHDVPGDIHGGPEGPPIDMQFLGRVINCRIELSQYDADVFKQLKTRVKDAIGGPGLIATDDIGKLLIQDQQYIRVVIANSNNPLNFPICQLVDAIDEPIGTKFTPAMFSFVAHRNPSSGLIFDTTVTDQ